jgi:hypothetical protein
MENELDLDFSKGKDFKIVILKRLQQLKKWRKLNNSGRSAIIFEHKKRQSQKRIKQREHINK